MNTTQRSLQDLRQGVSLSAGRQYSLIFRLALPAILAQVAGTLMQLIDASMAGRLGSLAAASIGLVASSTWLFSGICRGVIFGFSVQTAQTIGAGNDELAARICRQGLAAILLFALTFAMTGLFAAPHLPVWLHGDPAIQSMASAYFGWWCLFLPFLMLNEWAVQMLQATGNTRLPGMLQILMCALDVVFNWFFIFQLNLGVAGAAIGTGAAAMCTSLYLAWFTLVRSPFLSGHHSFRFRKETIQRAVKIGLPVSVEQLVTGSGYVIFTRIVAGLGSISVAANSFSITGESLAYMPGFGIASAASAIIGQCVGAGRKTLTRSLAWRIELAGITVMSVMGIALWLLAPALMQLLSVDPAVQDLGTRVLRIEAFAEPMYGAAIVATGILRGKGDTLWPTIISLVSNWGLRIPFAAAMTGYGLPGVWFAMAFELNCRGLLFLFRLCRSFPKDRIASSDSTQTENTGPAAA
ncbi:MATE family efflux transporter [Faecalibaculum rodentium]|uniref:MATE family efflux transporter n=2 Tax=Faecalibaculum rodentium TaxID=1702221 RepID=UPI00255B0790|nr:MATE family efflux transporter [Faecalibaculum rodentium]